MAKKAFALDGKKSECKKSLRLNFISKKVLPRNLHGSAALAATENRMTACLIQLQRTTIHYHPKIAWLTKNQHPNIAYFTRNQHPKIACLTRDKNRIATRTSRCCIPSIVIAVGKEAEGQRTVVIWCTLTGYRLRKKRKKRKKRVGLTSS